ncbi:tRNA pseudouridine(38-40) synthase TruA [Rubrolithibacter danxiaensis]|uniref:tRNA pseudouridine(38-40) synthase TruA n=1 Tax=Rubrolithibacter danxiaensis TaxID=3390805 RepID=UPI003BF903B3
MKKKQRYFLELSYKGTAYHGWQVQPNAVTVQEVLENALCTVFRQQIETVGCGRTDTGVHAKQFYAHFDLEEFAGEMDKSKVQSLNAVLPKDIAVHRIIEVEEDAHARFDATERSYEYHIHFQKDPFKQDYSWLLRDVPDLEAMNEAASVILEYRDFSCFSKSNTQVFTNNCLVSEAVWRRTDSGIVFRITADRFLRNMVRAIVGTLIPIGRGDFKPEGIRNIIESKNRSNAGTSVPACGLYLTRILYPYIDVEKESSEQEF